MFFVEMEDSEENTIIDKVGVAAVKAVTKFGLNMLLPGSGSSLDFAEAICNVGQGNYGSAAINIGSGVLDLVTLGLSGTLETVAKESGKKATVTAVKETSKSTCKQIGEEVGMQILKAVCKTLIVETAKSAAKQANKRN